MLATALRPFSVGAIPTLTACLLLAACGGGSGDSTAPTATALAATDAAGHGTATIQSSSRVSGTDAGFAPLTLAISSNSAAVGSAMPMGMGAMLYLDGVPERPTPVSPLATDPSGRTFYVDSSLGNDAASGLAAAAGSNNAGPWRTLARLAQSGVVAGDTVVLGCNSVWRETLRLPASGTAARPIAVRAPLAGCATPPAIDGSTVIASGNWTRHSGSVYKTTLSSPPLALYTASTTMTEAHHPNRGYMASDPGSLYAPLPVDGNVVAINGRQVSTQLVRGNELSLPVGTNLTGARLRLRTHAWLIDESTITADVNGRMSLATPTTFPATAGWGYYLVGQLWMLDSLGEWHYDPATSQLYSWLPSTRQAASSVSVSTLGTGIDMDNRSHVVIDGLSVRRVGTGMQARQSQHITLRNSRIEETAADGVDATVSQALVVEANAFTRIGTNAVMCWDENRGRCTGMVVRGNVMRDIGLVMDGERVVSLPISAHAAIRPGVSALIARNTIVNANHVGMRPGAHTVVEDNFVFGACSVLDDCAAIYAWADRDITIRRNTILHSRGALAGKAPTDAFTQAQGIYLDETTTHTLIEGNSVMDNDHGIQIHVSPNNTVRGNLLYGNRNSQLWLQENSRNLNPNGDLYGLQVVNNQFAAVSPGSVAMRLDTSYASTSGFGSFDFNRFYERATAQQIFLRTAAGSTTLTLAQWRASQGVGSTQAVDANGSGVGEGGYAEFSSAGGNVVPNAALAQGTAGWYSWNASSPSGQLTSEACATGRCLRYRAGGSAGMVSSPNFAIVQGEWYRLTVDVAAELPSQWLQVVVRRNGGVGASAYELLGNRYMVLTAGQTWGRYSITFLATVSATPDGLRDGARIDIEGVTAGRSLSIGNLELVRLARTSVAQVSSAHVNVSGSAGASACPAVIASAGQCNKLANLANNQAVSWPLPLPTVGSVLLYGQDSALSDSDLDGIPNAQDQCHNSAIGAVVNAAGCSYGQG